MRSIWRGGRAKAAQRDSSTRSSARFRGVAASLPLPARPAHAADRAAALDYFSITLSHPRWLAARWYDRLGLRRRRSLAHIQQRAGPCDASGEPPPCLARGFRAASRRGSGGRAARRGLRRTASSSKRGIRWRGPVSTRGGSSCRTKRRNWSRCSPARIRAARVLDACASPGGKSDGDRGGDGRCRPARRMRCPRPPGRTAATDRRSEPARADVRIVQADLLTPLPFGHRFDCVLVDAPCSGLGTLRRDPDIRWRRRESDLAPLAARHSSSCCATPRRWSRPADVWSTRPAPASRRRTKRSSTRSSTAAPQFAAVHAGTAHPMLRGSVVDGRGHLRTQPHVHGLEAFFGAVFQRKR